MTPPPPASHRLDTALDHSCCNGEVSRRHPAAPACAAQVAAAAKVASGGATAAGQRASSCSRAELAAAAAAELDPSRWQHRNLLGEVYLQQQNWDAAAQEFLATTQLDNQVASAFLKLGYALSKIPGYQDKALESRLIAARLNTDFADLDDEWNSRAPSRIQPIEGTVAA